MLGSSGERTRADAVRNRASLLQVADDARRIEGRPPSLKDLARRAGVGVGTVYRNFPTPASLLEALGAERMQQLVRDVGIAADDSDPVTAFERQVGAVLRGQLTDPGIAAIVAGPDEISDAGAAPHHLVVELSEAVDRLLVRAHRAGAIRDGIEAADIRRLLVGLSRALTPVAGDERIVTLYLRVLLDGLRPPRPEP